MIERDRRFEMLPCSLVAGLFPGKMESIEFAILANPTAARAPFSRIRKVQKHSTCRRVPLYLYTEILLPDRLGRLLSSVCVTRRCCKQLIPVAKNAESAKELQVFFL